MQKVFPLFRSRATQAAGMQRADWQRTCGRAAIFCRGTGRGRGGGGLLCLVSIIKTRQNREPEEGEGRRVKGTQAATWPSALGVIYALLMQIFAEAGERANGRRGRQLGLQSIDGWLHRSSDASESHRSIGKVAKRSDPNRTQINVK